VSNYIYSKCPPKCPPWVLVTRFDTSHHGRPQGSCGYSDRHPHCDAPMRLFVVNRSCVHKRIQTWRGAWRACSESSVTDNISHARKTFVLWLPVASADRVRGNLGQWLPMWRNVGAYRTVTNNNPCPHTNAELLLVSTQYSYKWNVSGHMLIRIFFYVELEPKICPPLSVTLCI
jgi:hypothetical protein